VGQGYVCADGLQGSDTQPGRSHPRRPFHIKSPISNSSRLHFNCKTTCYSTLVFDLSESFLTNGAGFLKLSSTFLNLPNQEISTILSDRRSPIAKTLSN
jgi:hypothetical protein